MISRVPFSSKPHSSSQTEHNKILLNKGRMSGKPSREEGDLSEFKFCL